MENFRHLTLFFPHTYTCTVYIHASFTFFVLTSYLVIKLIHITVHVQPGTPVLASVLTHYISVQKM